MNNCDREYYRQKSKEHYEAKRIKEKRLTKEENRVIQKEKIKNIFSSAPKRHNNSLINKLINEYELRNLTLKKSY